MKAYQVYEPMSKASPFTNENGFTQAKCICSNCGCPVFSEEFPSERTECPHCHAEFDDHRLITRDAWLADLQHVEYSMRECGREQ